MLQWRRSDWPPQPAKPSSTTGFWSGAGLALREATRNVRGVTLPRAFSWLPFAAILVPVTVALAWLLIFGVDHTGRQSLPDGADSTVEFFADPDGGLTLDEVVRRPAASWQSWSGTSYISAPPREVLWVRVTLRNATDRTQHGVLANSYYFTDRVQAWSTVDSTWEQWLSGEAVTAKTKAVKGREISFPVNVPAHAVQIIYLRAEDFFRAFLRPQWWPKHAAYYPAKGRSLLAEGIYFGGLLALLGYNTMLWARLRLKDIGFYALYLGTASTVVFLLRAYPAAQGWTLTSPALETLLAFTMALSGFFLTQFAREFLELKTRGPRADRLARGLQGVMIGLAAFALATPWMARPYAFPAVIMGIGVTHVCLFGLAIWVWRAGIRQARFFVMSFGCLFASSLFSVVAWFGSASFLDAAMMGLMIGSAAEMLLLSLAVADRFAQAQKKLVAETEQRRLMEETYAEELELEVRERTRELEAANADKDRMLAVIGHDLRSPLTGLMRSADQAAGEFAREAARTGRTLLLMIEDVVVWARLRAGSRGVAAHPAGALLAPAVALHRALAEHGGMELALDVPEELSVETDRVLVQTLVRNLLANALKFARTRVVLRAAADGRGGVRFTVGNDGPELSAAIAARLAAGVDEPMTATGGLGLRLCREICRTLGLRLEAGTGANGGTEFSFTIRQAAGPGGEKL